MKILHKYIAREFILPFFLILIAFAIILLISSLFDEMSLIMDNKAALGDAAMYFILKTPYLLLQITPLAVLLATLFCVGGLAKTNEVTAMRMSGAPLWYLLTPVFLIAFVISLLSILFNETVVPASNREADRIKSQKIEHHNPQHVDIRENVTYICPLGHIFYIRVFNEKLATMHQVNLFKFKGDRVSLRLDAALATYEEDGWHFKNGTLRTFEPMPGSAPEKETVRNFRETMLNLDEKPADFHLVEKKKTEHMTSMELWDHISELRRRGASHTRELVELNLKFAFPFANAIMALLAAPFAIQVKKTSGLVVGFCISLLVAFLYVGFIQMGRALGGGNIISPFWSVWLANILFAGIGVWRITRDSR